MIPGVDDQLLYIQLPLSNVGGDLNAGAVGKVQGEEVEGDDSKLGVDTVRLCPIFGRRPVVVVMYGTSYTGFSAE
jgi:hypothetical protein